MRSFIAIAAALLITIASSSAATAAATLAVRPLLPIMPVVYGVTQEIEIELSEDGRPSGEEQEMRIESKSGMGIVVTQASPGPSGSITYRMGTRLRVAYRWAGPLPTEFPVNELITVSVPRLGLAAETSFDVGVNLDMLEVKPIAADATGGEMPVEVTIQDIFHPNTDIVSLLSAIGITPELRLDLVTDAGTPITPALEDPVVKKFFGEGERGLNSPTTMPGFTVGRLQEMDGRVIWENLAGELPTIFPPSQGSCRIVATLKPNAGGIGLKERWSEPFAAGGGASAQDMAEMPDMMRSTFEIMTSLDAYRAGNAEKAARSALAAGDLPSAISQLGSGMRGMAAPTPVQTLGRYVHAIASSGQKIDDAADFIRYFLSGYGTYGTLLFTKPGVKSWSAVSSSGNPYTKAPKGRVYEDDSYVVIPFELEDNFTLSLQGSGSDGVSLWKIIPAGVNRKSYEKGDWDKEISVYGNTVTPPQTKPNNR
ncbi:MAG: hypothetical protein LBT08_03995 [Synergistaceae bacterium]|jgi:hypothetical protein|nr:hypothetical protein [Synergistaceae bacterium]